MSALERLGVNIDVLELNTEHSSTQTQTQQAFGFKWSKRDSHGSDKFKTFYKQWMIEKYCDNDLGWLDNLLSGERKIILDAGCGVGHGAMVLFGEHLKKHDYLGIDISDAVDIAKNLFSEAGYPGDFLKVNLFEIPIPDASVDIIYSEGVLHHTDNTESAVKCLTKKLKPGGKFMFYVYRQKAAVREFTDDYIREQLKTMTDEKAWDALESLTKLGIALGKLNVELDVPEDIPFLGIKKGKLDIQRFFYWNICKLYYRPEFSLDEMNHINFDWFRPVNCHRHTPEEVMGWCQQIGLSVDRMKVEDAGITVIATKQ